MKTNKIVNIVGGGLAGSECAYFLAHHGFHVNLYEMKPSKFSPAHTKSTLAEIVCSNSFKNDDVTTSSGLLKAEMRALGSLVLQIADKCRVGAGNALAVDREKFTEMVDEEIRKCKNIKVIEEEIIQINPNDEEIWVVATGPLTSDDLSKNLAQMLGEESLFYFDASAPIVTRDSLDDKKLFIEDRYGEIGKGDYINCPLNQEEYEKFYEELINAQTIELKDFENDLVFEGCMPIEVMAKRGKDTLRYGPLKPVGLGKDLPERPYAVVQLRKENIEELAYNMVGFQTNLTFSEQKRVFSIIPALKDADFLKYGVMHRNTYINSPKHLNRNFRMRENENVYFAGQISGVEGYMESTASGLCVAISIVMRYNGNENFAFSNKTMIGALAEYISNPANKINFQPMSSNYGIVNSVAIKIRDKKEKRQEIYNQSMLEIEQIRRDLCQ